MALSLPLPSSPFLRRLQTRPSMGTWEQLDIPKRVILGSKKYPGPGLHTSEIPARQPEQGHVSPSALSLPTSLPTSGLPCHRNITRELPTPDLPFPTELTQKSRGTAVAARPAPHPRGLGPGQMTATVDTARSRGLGSSPTEEGSAPHSGPPHAHQVSRTCSQDASPTGLETLPLGIPDWGAAGAAVSTEWPAQGVPQPHPYHATCCWHPHPWPGPPRPHRGH